MGGDGGCGRWMSGRAARGKEPGKGGGEVGTAYIADTFIRGTDLACLRLPAEHKRERVADGGGQKRVTEPFFFFRPSVCGGFFTPRPARVAFAHLLAVSAGARRMPCGAQRSGMQDVRGWQPDDWLACAARRMNPGGCNERMRRAASAALGACFSTLSERL